MDASAGIKEEDVEENEIFDFPIGRLSTRFAHPIRTLEIVVTSFPEEHVTVICKEVVERELFRLRYLFSAG